MIVCKQLVLRRIETIAVIAKDKRTFEKWQEEHQFYNTNKTHWRYIYEGSLTIGIKYTMLLLIGDYWNNPKLGELTMLVHKNMIRYGNRGRTFTSERG